ncbi:MAG TPA: guanylate kinase [Pyrinomonadaceae bacterium]|nr:guanylate kinase [Pyrinomonadaceae bacterium]
MSSAKETELETEPENVSRTGLLFVVSSPSGGGKGTLIKRLLDVQPDLSYSVSYTTRVPRNGEQNGREYHFVDRTIFEEMIRAGEFLEWACVHGNYYGTARKQVAEETAAGRDLVLEVDVQGAASVRQLRLDAISIFIVPPSYETLRKRLTARGTDTPEQLTLRLRNAPNELNQYREFDYVIINDNLDRAAAQLAAIVSAERARGKRQKGHVEKIIEEFKTNQQ